MMAVHPTLRGTLLRLADRISPPPPPPAGGWRDELPEAFAALHSDGSIMCIGYQGEWYWPIKPGWRVRVHNWLVKAAASKPADTPKITYYDDNWRPTTPPSQLSGE